MTLSIATVFVLVDDPEAALDFYRDKLGLNVAKDFTNDGFRWITVTTDSQPGIEILLSHPLVGHSEQDGQALAALLAKGELTAIHFRSDDLDGAFERLVAAGVDVVQEPTSQPWGTRDFAVRDPAGNMIRVLQA